MIIVNTTWAHNVCKSLHAWGKGMGTFCPYYAAKPIISNHTSAKPSWGDLKSYMFKIKSQILNGICGHIAMWVESKHM